MVATINSLPLELIRLILEADDSDEVQTYENGERLFFEATATLLAAALVCSAWTTIAQELLSKEVYLSTARPQAMAAFARRRRLPIDKLVITWAQGVRIESAVPLEAILDGLSGVRDLTFTDWRDEGDYAVGEDRVVFELGYIRGAGFKHLDHLTSTRLYLCVDDHSLPLPFSLSALAFERPEGQDYLSLHYLVTQCQPSLVELDLILPPPRPFDLPYLATFIPIAHQLSNLDLRIEQDDPMATTFLTGCTAVSYLAVGYVKVPWVKALRVALKDLRVKECLSEDVDRLIELIKDGVLGVSKLERLMLEEDTVSKPAGVEGAEGDDLDNWGESAKVCREKGLKIEAFDEFGLSTSNVVPS